MQREPCAPLQPFSTPSLWCPHHKQKTSCPQRHLPRGSLRTKVVTGYSGGGSQAAGCQLRTGVAGAREGATGKLDERGGRGKPQDRHQQRWQRWSQVWKGVGGSYLGREVQLAMMCLTNAGKEDRVSHRVRPWIAKGGALRPQRLPPADSLPAEFTFVIDAAIGVFLPCHQLLHLVFCQPLTWREWKAESALSRCEGLGDPPNCLWMVSVPLQYAPCLKLVHPKAWAVTPQL